LLCLTHSHLKLLGFIVEKKINPPDCRWMAVDFVF
jgi:hypothetical protein